MEHYEPSLFHRPTVAIGEARFHPLSPSQLARYKAKLCPADYPQAEEAGLIFAYPSFADGQAVGLTAKGEERISYLADREGSN